MQVNRKCYLNLIPLAVLAGAVLVSPQASFAQDGLDALGYPKILSGPPAPAFKTVQDSSADDPARYEGGFLRPISNAPPAPMPLDSAAMPAMMSDYADSSNSGCGPDCFAAEGESWLDWHGVGEVFEHPDDNPGFGLSYFQECEFPEEEPELLWEIGEGWAHILEMPHEPLVKLSEFLTGAHHDGTVFTDPDYSYTTDVAIGIQPIMDRPNLPLGEYPLKFLGKGTIPEGYELPTGAVWRPTVWIFGSNRLGASYRDDQGGRNFGSVVNRLNLFGQLNLSGTEHVVIQMRPFDEEEGRPLLTGREFQSYFWKPHTLAGTNPTHHLDGLNGDIQSLYFEGQLDEIFPNIDPFDTRFLDYGFSVGRQAMSFQRGLMVNEDMIDAVTVTRNTLYGHGNLNLRMTGVFAWNRATRVSPMPATDAKMYGLFTESDFKFNTMNLDVGFLDDPNPANGDLLVAAISSTQRLVGHHNTYNSRFHMLASFPTAGTEGTTTGFMGSTGNVSGQGELFFSQISVTPHRSEDLIYWNTFVAIDQFTSLARAPQAGPLGDTGLLFAAAGLGLYGPPLATVTNSSVGTALGYQVFLDTKEQQIIYEVGIRNGKGADNLEAAGAIQYQRAFGQNWIWLVTGFLSGREGTTGLSTGLRTEIQLFF